MGYECYGTSWHNMREYDDYREAWETIWTKEKQSQTKIKMT